jgi:hypothetical protein
MTITEDKKVSFGTNSAIISDMIQMIKLHDFTPNKFHALLLTYERGKDMSALFKQFKVVVFFENM